MTCSKIVVSRLVVVALLLAVAICAGYAGFADYSFLDW